jgi:hypothetical protein
LQEQLVFLARKLRGENDDTNIRLYQDGGAPEGQITDLLSGDAGSIIVERPDRLLRHEHGLTIDLLQKQHITVIVPGKRVYDLNKEEDLKAFQMNTQDAYHYIETHIEYMRNRKSGRRERQTPPSAPIQKTDAENE